MPEHSSTLIRAAWDETGGDIQKSTSLLSQPEWRLKRASANDASAESTGRVKELDEVTRAMRAAAKERGKKSLIYANRGVLEVKTASPSTPSTSNVTLDLTQSPLSPVVAPRLRRRVQRLIDSDSEPEIVEVDKETVPILPRLQQGSSEERRALEFLNSKDAEALQELTGTFSHLYCARTRA